MKYHQFVPDPEAISARIAGREAIEAPPLHGAPAGAPGGSEYTATAEIPATLEALTALRDRAFIEAAYRVVLGREADPEGCEHRLLGLRGGAFDKVDILGDLRDSPEGRARAIDIPGLGWRYSVRRAGRLPVIGWFMRSVEAALRLPTVLRVAQRHQAAIELASVEAEQHAAAIQRVQRELHDLRGLATRIATAERALGEMFGEVRMMVALVDDIRHEIRTLRDETTLLAGKVGAAEHGFEARHQRLSAAVARVTRQLEQSASGATRVRSTDAGPQPALAGDNGIGRAPDRGVSAADVDRFYLEFEDRFRGSREDIKRLQETYLVYVRAAGAGSDSAPVLDVGCGRGEWLELLKEHGFQARGIDQNRVMLAENLERGLNVGEDDVLAHLGRLPDDSLGMVTGFHIIEHLPFEALVQLFDECHRVLRPGGCAVFETPNPENLVVSGYTFHLDPTHRRPLPPAMTEFLAWQRGFADVEIVRLHPRPERGSDHALLDTWFRSPTDYAVIGWKDRKGGASG
jgi:SAM-dependent methyltransferase